MDNINNWLNGITSKYSNITNKEYIQSIFSILYGWLKTNHRLYLNYTPEEILRFFYIFIYNKHLFINESCEMIDIYFTSDIINIFFDIREKYGTTLLEERGITPDDLLIFLNYVTYFYEDDNLNDEEEFTYLDENIM